MLKNLTIPLDVTISYLKKEYSYYEAFNPYSLTLIKELLTDNSDFNEIVNYLEKITDYQSEKLAESIDCDIDYYFDLFSVLKIYDSSRSVYDLTEIRSYMEETEKIQSNIIFEKIKLSLIPYFDIVTKKTIVNERIEQYFEYLSRKIYDYSNEENTFLDYDFNDEKFNTMVKNIDRIFKENKYEKKDKSTSGPVRNKIRNELFSYTNNPADSNLRNKVNYIKLVLLLSTNGFRPRLIDRYRIAICGLTEEDMNQIINNISTASSKRISKLFLYYRNPNKKINAPTNNNQNSINTHLLAITNKVAPYFIKKLKGRCFGLLLSDNLKYYSLSGIMPDKPVTTNPILITNIETILREQFNNIMRSRLSDKQITFYDIYSKKPIPEPYFEYKTPLQRPMTLLQFKSKYKITNVFAKNANNSYHRCFSCCEPKLLVNSNKTEDKFILYVKQEPCQNCQLIIPEYKDKLQTAFYYNKTLGKIDRFTI